MLLKHRTCPDTRAGGKAISCCCAAVTAVQLSAPAPTRRVKGLGFAPTRRASVVATVRPPLCCCRSTCWRRGARP